uniref:ANK_REP_REGION domain-containing protein n=1 Tax=Macrostomum lignano TaxID=282301 RepID=A0A1I8FSC2_9PLAT
LWYTIALLRQYLVHHRFAPPVLWYTIALLRQFSGTPSLCSASSLVHHRFAPPVLWYTSLCSASFWYTIALLRQFFGTPSLCSASTLVHHRFAPPVLWYTIALLRQYSGTPSLCSASTRFAPQYSEHDIPERVELSVFADSQRLHSLAFNFTPDPLLGVAADIADKFPLVPESLSSLASGGQAAADTDRRLCAALRKCGRLADAAAETGEPDGGEPPPRRTAFHCLAEAGWLESLAQLLRLTGQPEFWLLGQPEPEGGRTAVQLLRERRFRSLLASPGRLRAWLEQLDGRASRLQGQEDSVVKVRSWRTPSGADLVFMTTNKEKADTPLEQDLSIFPHLEVGHVEGEQSTPTKETACAQTEVGRSIEDLLDSQTASAAVAAYRYDCGHFAETDSLVLGPSGEMSMSHSMSQSMSPSMSHSMSQSMSPSMSHSMSQSMIYPESHSTSYSMSHSMSQSMMQSVLFDSPSDEMRSLQQQQQQQQQLEHASWSISTSSLIEDAASLPPAWEAADDEAFQHPSQTRRRKLGVGRPHPMESLADDAGSSLPWAAGRAHNEFGLLKRAAAPEEAEELPVQAERQQPGQRRGGSGRRGKIKGGGSRLATYEHSWRIATAGVCAVCEARQSRVCLLVCRVCHLTVHNADACRSQTVPCLPPMASQAACGAAAPRCHCLRDFHGCRSFSIPGSPLRRLAEVSEEPFRD